MLKEVDQMAKKMKTAKKSTTKKLVAKAKPVLKIDNRRKSPRIPTSDVWVTETMGDFQFVSEATNVSEGGIFLSRRLKTVNESSDLRIHFKSGTVDVKAHPLHDRIGAKEFGTGYAFIFMSDAQTKALRSAIRAL